MRIEQRRVVITGGTLFLCFWLAAIFFMLDRIGTALWKIVHLLEKMVG